MSRTRQPRRPFKVSESLNRRLNTYALAASAAGVSALALTGGAEAKVIYTETHQVTSPHVPIFIDLNNDGIKDFVLRTAYYVGSSYYRVGLNAFGYNAENVVAGKRFGTGDGYFFSAAYALPAGARVGSEREFLIYPFMADELFKRDVRSSGSDEGPWAGKGKGVKNRYLGLKFIIDGKVHYGWARVSVTLGHERQANDVSGTLTGYAYETVPNKPIIAGHTEGTDVTELQLGTLGELACGKK